jgi:subtilisin family serine protease
MRRSGPAAIVLMCALAAAAGVEAESRRAVKTAADLPRFSYPVTGSASDLLTADDATFAVFAGKVRQDIDGVLAHYDVQDHATLRGLLLTRLELEMMSGREDAAALKTIAEIRALEDKPAAKLLSGVRNEALIRARISTGQSAGPAYAAAYAKAYGQALAALPWAPIAASLKESRAPAEFMSRAVEIGQVEADIGPAAASAHAIDGDMAGEMVAMRFALKVLLPVKAETLSAMNAEIAANNVVKPEIWTAREVTLTDADHLTPVTVAIWDTGSDLSLFPGRVYADPHPVPGGAPHGLSYDMLARPEPGLLMPLSPADIAAYPSVRAELKGISDLQLAIDSPEADAIKKKVAAMSPAEVAAYFETLEHFLNYAHGTHVAGIAARGNPAIRLAVARLEFDWRNKPYLPTYEIAARLASEHQAMVAWMRAHGVRVANMSWGVLPSDYETALEKNGVGKDADERKAMARKMYDIERAGLFAALKSAPEILFVCAAGNENADSSFDEAAPAAFSLPNLITVGAVDHAGDEASFTSYGDTVMAYASGFQVESVVPGGAKIKLSGTSMASPNTVNLAAKLLALDPALTPPQVIKLIVDGASVSADGRRRNIDPNHSVELLRHHRATGAPIG